jgi:hypothetical protein
MQKSKPREWKQVQIEKQTKRKIDKVVFDNEKEFDIRDFATALIESALTNHEQVKDLIEKLKAESMK